MGGNKRMDYETEKRIKREAREEARKLASGLSKDKVQELALTIGKKMESKRREITKLQAMWSTLKSLEHMLLIKSLPLDSNVKYRGIPLYGPATRIAGRVGKLKGMGRKFAKVRYDNGLIWNIPFMSLEPVPEGTKDSQWEKGLAQAAGKVLNDVFSKETQKNEVKS
jgi:hypothetical protein